jgi:hypothetical protein
MTNTDPLAAAVRAAEDAHAAICKTGTLHDVLVALRAVYVATLALAVDSGENESQVLYAIEDIDAEIARLA